MVRCGGLARQGADGSVVIGMQLRLKRQLGIVLIRQQSSSIKIEAYIGDLSRRCMAKVVSRATLWSGMTTPFDSDGSYATSRVAGNGTAVLLTRARLLGNGSTWAIEPTSGNRSIFKGMIVGSPYCNFRNRPGVYALLTNSIKKKASAVP